MLYFLKTAEGLGEQKGQHICSANASHLWLSASLAVWIPQLESHGEKLKFQGFSPMDTLHPEENGGSEADFAKQSA